MLVVDDGIREGGDKEREEAMGQMRHGADAINPH